MLKKTPLNEIHKSLGARMVEFGGWEMPVQYTGVIDEHNAVRNAVGLFDISHMGEIIVEGELAKDFINYITTNKIDKIKDGGCQYAAVCNPDGGCVDDVISYQYNPQKYLVVVNASNTDKDFAWFTENNMHGVSIANVSPQYCQLALQGPKAEATLQPLIRFPLGDLKYYTFCETEMKGIPIILSRTGYTGEDGFEIYGASNRAVDLWNMLMKAGEAHGIKPIGLAARDTLRLEPSYSLYGHEITDTVNPLEARLGWVVALDKPDFIGKDSLEKIKQSGVKRTIIGLEMIDKAVPRQGYEIENASGKIGVVTSGTFSPTLEKSIAMALIDKKAADHDEFFVVVRGKKMKAKKISLPFYKRK
ncbi:glycine cleavage system aminomethyltransferase GcvT [bacterium]|nr:glycine cleavage system aminomethyltransferase GcvT [bacterium]